MSRSRFASTTKRIACAIGPTLLEKTFTDFGLNVKVVGINTGPVITQYEIALETGLRVNKVTSLADDLALNLACRASASSRRFPGKNTVGIEVPNEHRADGAPQGSACLIAAPKIGEAQDAAVPRQGHRGPAARSTTWPTCRTCSSPAAPAPASRCA